MRTRLIIAVAVVAAAIAAAGAPALLTASQDLSDSQDLVTLAARTQDALALAHSLADERDEVTSYIAAGRPKAKAPSEQRSARVDRQVEDLRADTDTPVSLRTDLDAIAAVRRAALTGKTNALQTHQAYSATISELHRLADNLADQLPPRAGSGAYSLAELDSAVQQSAAARGLLLAALNIPSTTQTVISPTTGLPTTTTTTTEADRKQRDALTAAAQQARLRADAALADFRETAPKAAVASYDSTVTGPEVNSAEKYLAALTDQPTLTGSEPTTSTKKLDAALSARVDLMRGAESALYDHRTKDLAVLRDDDVTALEIRVAVLGALMLVTVGIATAMARTLTRPLSVLRRGSARLAEAADPVTQEPITFTGRNDEFAQVVRSVNALHAHAVALHEQTAAAHERVTTLETDRKHLVGQRQKMADAREELRAELADSAAQLERLRGSIGGTFVNLSLRTLGLVERQLAVIEGLEEREQDPERLATLFKLDHFATVMRRHSENLLVLAGTEHVQQHHGPVPLVDVVRAAVSEIERYERVRIAALPPHAHVAGFAADDLSHLLAELMENATSFSPPEMPVEVSGWLLESGEVMLSVQDEGIGLAADRLDRLNSRLTDFDPASPYDQEGEAGLGLGLYVVARLAHRHGVRVQLREQKQGGVAAVVVLPQPLLTEAPATAPPSDTTQTIAFPGATAEANSNVLPARPKTKTSDPLVALAEKAVREAEEPTPEPAAGETYAGAADAESAAGGTYAGATDPEPAAGERYAGAAGAEPAAGEAYAGVTDPEPAPGGTVAGVAEQEPAPGETHGGAVDPEPAYSETHAGVADSEPAPGETHAGAVEQDTTYSERLAGAVDPEPAHSETYESAADLEPVPGETYAGAVEQEPAHSGTRESVAGREPVPGETYAGAAQQMPAHSETYVGAVGPEAGTVETHGRADVVESSAAESPTRPKAPAETFAETTMELLLPDLTADPTTAPAAEFTTEPAAADGEDAPPGPPAPDDESRTGGAGGDEDAEGEAEAVTSKGLPKRTPRITAPAHTPRQRTSTVDAEALRRRLGGFRQGAQAGYRDVEAEIAERTEETTGGTVEEASS
ncbi:histidine kinase [Streptomyces diastatochromogenes]|uniref:histidine kinase n=1 Tax=Streptomyces diastatochromogenes TaxID=42236 RepID=A0A233SP36_STRDA|nr:histidine kinase [Streptomyces diastatochromogenes]